MVTVLLIPATPWLNKCSIYLVALYRRISILYNVLFSNIYPVLWIWIRIGSVFRSFVDPDSYLEYRFGSRSTHINTAYNKMDPKV